MAWYWITAIGVGGLFAGLAVGWWVLSITLGVLTVGKK